MEGILERLESRFDAVTQTLLEIKAENLILRKEILGLSSKSDNSSGLLDIKTLRQLVEEIQFQLNKIQDNLEKNCESKQEEQHARKRETLKPNRPRKIIGIIESDEEVTDEDSSDDQDFKVLEIRSKTFEEERKWLKAKFEGSQMKIIQDGASFHGNSFEVISSSIPIPSVDHPTTCALQISNHLNYPLTHPEFCYWNGTKVTGPPVIDSYFSEVFLGNGGSCEFLSTFSVNKDVRLMIRCINEDVYNIGGEIIFWVGFIPQNVPTDRALNDKLFELEWTPSISINKEWSKDPMELFVAHGKFIARGYMKASGIRAMVQVDILDITEINPPPGGTLSPIMAMMKKFKNQSISKSSEKGISEYSCSFQLENRLKVGLRSRERFYSTSNRNIYIPKEVPPLGRTAFVVSESADLEGMFFYEIEHTDLCFVVAVRRGQAHENSFAAAFIHHPVAVNRIELGKLMDEDRWKTIPNIKHAKAKCGEQVVEIRNIKARISMTEDEHSQVRIKLFTF